MIPKRNKVSGKEVETAFKTGKRFSSSFFFLIKIPSNKGISQFAPIVSKKISKKSVVRNRIKRRIFGALETFLAQIPEGIYVIQAKTDISKENFSTLVEDLKNLLKIQ